jgi:TPR repeat protein
LEARIAALEAALTKSRSGSVENRRAPVLVYLALTLALGTALGAGLGGLNDVFADLALRLALSRADPSVESALAAHRRGRYEAALRMAGPLAEAGDARAQLLLGDLHYHGRGVARNDAEAMRWFRLAAEQGEAEARFHLGVMYDQGQSVPEDDAEAVRWYRLAAEQGHAPAQYNLGLAYARGEGVAPSMMQAHVWFNLSATRLPASDTRQRAAVRNRDLVASKLSREELAEAQRRAREWQPR